MTDLLNFPPPPPAHILSEVRPYHLPDGRVIYLYPGDVQKEMNDPRIVYSADGRQTLWYPTTEELPIGRCVRAVWRNNPDWGQHINGLFCAKTGRIPVMHNQGGTMQRIEMIPLSRIYLAWHYPNGVIR